MARNSNNLKIKPSEITLNRAVKEQLDNILPEVKGSNLINLGHLPDGDLLSASPILQHLYITPSFIHTGKQRSCVIADYKELPILADSVDAIICDRVLENYEEADEILREIWRILAPEGKVVIIGYNRNTLFRTSAKSHYEINLLNPNKLRKNLLGFGFEVIKFKTFVFRPSEVESSIFWSLFEKIVPYFGPNFGRLYLFVATKPVITLNPILDKAQWKKQLQTKGVVVPT